MNVCVRLGTGGSVQSREEGVIKVYLFMRMSEVVASSASKL